jgi:hypothetical protein
MIWAGDLLMRRINHYRNLINRKQLLTLSTSALFVLIAGCAGNPVDSSKTANLEGRIPAEKLLAVDCLLPPEIRKLGRFSTFASARRPIKTTALDCEIRGGEYVAYDRSDYRTALNVWLGRAKEGDPEAQTYLGEIYEKGLGLAPDYDAAFTWYSKAAEQGFSRAQVNLGYLYEKGLGVKQDPVKALNYYRLSSGISEDIDYSSKIQTEAENIAAKQTSTLKKELSKRDREIKNLRASLAESKRLLEQRQRMLQEAIDKTEGLNKTIEERRHTQTENAELVRAYNIQKQLIEKERQSINALKAEIARNQETLSKPSIEILDPPILATRGSAPSLRVRSGSTAQVVRGRIVSQSGIRQATINGRSLSIDSQGLFHSAVPVADSETTVTVTATDTQGQTDQFVFVLISDQPKQTAEVTATQIGRIAKSIDFGRYFALVIGNNEYQNHPHLQTAVNDAQKVSEELRSRFGFETLLLTNADRYTILSAINELRGEMTEKDNLLVYYAGHGEIDQATKQGYWLPVDAEPRNSANWISNASISDLLNTIKAKHVLVIADSCYSGSMSRSSIPRLNTQMNEEHLQKWLKLMTKTKSRTVLTSGGLEPVLDSGGGEHSVFAKAFLEELRGSKGVIDAYRVYRNVSGQVEKNAATSGFSQVPTYAPIQHAGHGGGEFILVSG